MEILEKFAEDIIKQNPSIPEDLIYHCLQLALENSCARFFRTARCYADLNYQEVNLEFPNAQAHVGIKILSSVTKTSIQTDTHLHHHTLNINELPQRIFRMCLSEFRKFLALQTTAYQYKNWSNKINTTIKGVITDKYDDLILVYADNIECQVPKRYWIHKEGRDYQQGREFFFNVNNVFVNPDQDHITIILSRRAKNMPARLLKTFLPEYKFYCTRRLPGNKCWIKTNMSKKEHKKLAKARKEVSKLLGNEFIQTETDQIVY